MKFVFTTGLALGLSLLGMAQYTLPDSTALEGIIVERYYVSDTLDVTDTDGGTLDTCSVTYRIYVDLKPDYKLQAVYGNSRNLLRIESTTLFFNNEDRGEITGDLIGSNYLDNNTVALDSWLTMGPASNAHWGVLKAEDTDGSIVGGDNNDGGSESVDGGLLVYNHEQAGLALTDADGLLAGTVPTITSVGLDLGVFADATEGSLFETQGGAWSVLEGVVGPTDENKILIAQITTQGTLSFRLNIQIGIPQELQCSHPDCHSTIQYVAVLHPDDAVQSVETDNIFEIEALNFTSEPVVCSFSTGVQEFDNAPEVLIYPNPTSGASIVNIRQQVADAVQLTVFDGLGKHCLTQAVAPSLHQNVMLDLSTLPAGLYTVAIQNTNGTVTQQIVKY
ncbi:MAG: hypothetical protein RL226_2334 [Bacteroidota bacterium]|jgi:hypothetical protein